MSELKKLCALYKENKKAFWKALFRSVFIASMLVLTWTNYTIKTIKHGEFPEQSYAEREMLLRNAMGGIIAKTLIFILLLTLFLLASNWPFYLGKERFSFHRWIIKKIKKRFHKVDEVK